MVIRNDSILYEKYDKGYSDSTLATTFSIAKSMLSVLVGQALADGRIKSLDDPILNYIPELSANSAYSTLILRDLFTMKSGLAFRDTNGGIINAFFSDEAKYYYTDDMKRELLKVKRVGYPGQAWQYKSIDAILLGWVVEKATKKSLAQYFQERLWQRIGTQYPASWGLDHVKGLTNTASRFQVTAIDLAKVGRLYLNDGQYNGQQVVPQDWVLQTIKMQGRTPVTSKGWQKTTQNYLWWLPQEGVNGEYAAEGMLGQRLYVDPLTKTIIVVFADKGGGDYPYRKVSRYLAGMPFSYPKILN
nr:serine hydrolase [Pedobacter sp. ASV12]